MSIPKSKILTLPAFVTKNALGSFFDAQDLCAIAQTCRQNRDSYKNNCKASELLFYGLNINKARKKKILEILSVGAQTPILTPVNGRQVYNDRRLKQTVSISIRIYDNLSPLEAAVLCGDFHLLQLLLAHLTEDQNHQALLQLKKIREKLVTHPRGFIELISNVQKAVIEFSRNEEALLSTENWGELNRLGGVVGENQKALPWFILQVFCRRDNLPPNKEPERECMIGDDEKVISELELADLGGFWQYALCKGQDRFVNLHIRCRLKHPFKWDPSTCKLDLKTMDNISTVILEELDKIIKLQEQRLMLAEYPDAATPSASTSCSAP